MRHLLSGQDGRDMRTLGNADGGRTSETSRTFSARNWIRLLVLAGVVWMGSGCATARIVEESRDHLEEDPKTHQMVPVQGNKAVYTLTPVTVAWDVATAPILGIGLLWLWASGYRGC
jgi:hypothetical protein